MKARLLFVSAALALFAAAGCKNDKGNSSSSGGPVAAGEAVVDFPSTDANVWVNGSAVKLGDLRGDVVLVEAWHRQ
jgi:hypothetical protein